MSFEVCVFVSGCGREILGKSMFSGCACLKIQFVAHLQYQVAMVEIKVLGVFFMIPKLKQWQLVLCCAVLYNFSF